MTNYYVRGDRRPVPDVAGFDEYLDPRHTAVISIDMHEGHLSESPLTPSPCPRGRDIVQPINDFHTKARVLGIPVIHVRSDLRVSGLDDLNGIPSAWRLFASVRDTPPTNLAEHAIHGSKWTEFRTDVEPGDEIIDTKKRFSAFYPTDLDFLLRQMNIKTVVFNGIMSHCCILNSAFDAQGLNYRVVVLNDLTRGADEELEQASLTIMSLHVGMVMDSEELVDVWTEGGRITTSADAATTLVY